MDSKILSYADEILSIDSKESRAAVRGYLEFMYHLSFQDIDAVISVLEGEGYFDD